jgi:putative membrane protein
LGLFGLLVNALIILALPYFISGFVVETFLSAVLFSIVLSLIMMFFSLVQRK